MDRIDFSKSIDVDPVLQIEKFFDEVMAMYNLVEGIKYNCIHGVIDYDNGISFMVTFNSPHDVAVTCHNINHKIVQFCNCNFMIDVDMNGFGSNEALIKLIKT